MEIWLARHGETEWSRDGRHTSITDVPLTPDGERAARALAGVLGSHRFDRVLTSPMRRARDTASLSGYGERMEVSDLLFEYRYGDYEGRTRAEIRARRPGWDLWRDGCPGGDTTAAVAARAERLLALIEGSSGDVLLFGHGHLLRVLAARYVGLRAERARHLKLDAGSVSVLGHEHEWPAITWWNRPIGDGAVGGRP